jgi:hypothetical protein
MSMIFDGFENMDRAREFVAAVHERFGLDGQTFSSAEAAYEHNWFPFEQVPPIACINRQFELLRSTEAAFQEFCATENAVEKLVSEFGGEFIGT